MTDTTTEAEDGGTPGRADPAGASQPHKEPHHIWRMVVIWAVLSLVGDLLFWFLVGPHVPPGDMTDVAVSNQFDFNVLLLAALPVLIAVWVYLAYSLIVWRGSRKGAPEPVGGAQARTHLGVQVGWIVTTTVIVLALFVFGTVELITNAGSGGGEGPNPIWTPTSASVLPVQVIAQQWKFTYRYPTFGGFESQQLVLPNDTTIAFHVTSLDVIHSFWAYQLSIKADANPQLDNVAYGDHPPERQRDRAVQRAVRLVARCHVQLRQGGTQGRLLHLGQGNRTRHRGQHQEPARRSRGPTFPTPTVPTVGTIPTTSTPTATQRSTVPFL